MKTNSLLSRNRLGLNKASGALCYMPLQLATRPQITARPTWAISFLLSPPLSFIFPIGELLSASPPCHGKTTKTLDRVFVIFCANVGVEAHAASFSTSSF